VHRASDASGEQGDPRASDHVERLLDALGRSRDEFANVYGDRVALDSVDGWHGIDPERTAAFRRPGRTTAADVPTQTRNLLAGAVGVGAIGFVLSNPLPNLAGFLMLASWVGIAALLYFDGKRVTESTDWSPSYARWAAAALVPILNVSVGTAYLVERHAQFSETGASDVADAWHRALIAAVVLSVVGGPLVSEAGTSARPCSSTASGSSPSPPTSTRRTPRKRPTGRPARRRGPSSRGCSDPSEPPGTWSPANSRSIES
jgi:hypothetical protein